MTQKVRKGSAVSNIKLNNMICNASHVTTDHVRGVSCSLGMPAR